MPARRTRRIAIAAQPVANAAKLIAFSAQGDVAMCLISGGKARVGAKARPEGTLGRGL